MDNLLTNNGSNFSTEHNKHSPYLNSLRLTDELSTINSNLIGGLSIFYRELDDQQKKSLNGIVERALKSGDTYIERKMARELAQ